MSDRHIIVYSLEQAKAAAQAAAECRRPIVLLSAPGMAGFMGPMWFKALADTAAATQPDAQITAALDCAAEAGTVLAALRCGFKRVLLSGAEDARARLDDVAGQMGALVVGFAPDTVLDLLDSKDPLASCRAFLAPD